MICIYIYIMLCNVYIYIFMHILYIYSMLPGEQFLFADAAWVWEQIEHGMVCCRFWSKLFWVVVSGEPSKPWSRIVLSDCQNLELCHLTWWSKSSSRNCTAAPHANPVEGGLLAMIIWTMCRWFVVHSYRIPSVWTAQVKQELMEEPWISAEILRTFSPRTRQMLSRLPDTPQSRQIVQQMLDVHGQYRHLLACAISVYLYIYLYLYIIALDAVSWLKLNRTI